MKLIFYTIGDTRAAPPPRLARAGLTLSQLYQRYAQAIRGTEILTAATDNEAQQQIDQRISRGLRYEQIVFVGHGLQGGYFFSGRPQGRDNFIAPDMSYVFDAGDTPLMQSLERALNNRLIAYSDIQTSPSIEFHSCYTGAGTNGLLQTMTSVLNGIRTPGHLVRILGYINYFRWSPVVNRQGQIVNWQNAVVDPASHRVISGGTAGTLTPTAELEYHIARIPGQSHP